MNKSSLKDFFIDLVKNIRLFEVHVHNKVETLNIGGRSVTINGNKGHVAGLGDFEFVSDGKGGMRPKFLESEVEPISGNPENNIHSLDSDQKVFVLADIAESAIHLSKPVSGRHECIIRELKPILAVRPKDLGALVLSAQIIRIEDERDTRNFPITEDLRHQLSTCFHKRGSMIYNLYRSDILLNEIIPHQKRQQELIPDPSKHIQVAFLAYWDEILGKGYPTAHFIGWGEDYVAFERELNTRFLSPTITKVRIYSRTEKRNQLVHRWCQKYVGNKKGFNLSCGGTYRLGFSQAIIFTINATHRC